MNRIIIINEVPYICPKAYEVLNFIDTSFKRKAKVIPKNEQKEEDNLQNIYTFGSIYDGHLVTVKYIKIPTVIPLEVFFDNEQKITIYSNTIGIDMDPNSNQLWAFYFGVWYKVSGSPKEILYYINKTLKEEKGEPDNLDKETNENIVATSKVQKFDTPSKNDRIYHSPSIHSELFKAEVEKFKTDVDKKIEECINRKYIFPVKNIIANMAKWIYSLDPINNDTGHYVHKIYISTILHLLYMSLIKDGCRLEIPSDDFYYLEYTKEELRKHLHFLIYDCPKTKEYFSKLNLSYNEMKNGIEVSDPNRNTISLSSRFSGPKWEDDFIDLDALINNVVLECVKDAVATE